MFDRFIEDFSKHAERSQAVENVFSFYPRDQSFRVYGRLDKRRFKRVKEGSVVQKWGVASKRKTKKRTRSNVNGTKTTLQYV